MKVSIYRAIKEDPFYSVEVYANNLVRVLSKKLEVNEIAFSRRKQGVTVKNWLDGPLNRYVLYPIYAISRQSEVNHILDHAYGHLGFVLDQRRTVISCNSMVIPKVMTGEIKPFPLPKSLRATMWLRHQGMLRCARVVACSHALKADIVRLLKCDPDRVSVVYDGLDHSLFKPVQDQARLRECAEAYGIPRDGSKLLLVVATKAAYKNRLATLKVLSSLKSRGLMVTLLIVGAPLTREERQFIEDQHIAQNVRLPGHVPEQHLPVIYSLADAFLFPSWDEGFGYPPLEAMACGTPTVVSSIPVLRETTGIAALSAPPDDIVGLTDMVQTAMYDDEARVRLRQYGLARAKLYTWERYADEIVDVYKSVDCHVGRVRCNG